jgi:hypothetical protein
VTEGETAQERPQRRGRADVVEQPAHPAVPQQIHVLDGVGAGDHPRHQRENLRGGVRAALRGDPNPVSDQAAEPASGSQRQHRSQPDARHQIRIIEPHRHRAASVR